MKKQYLIFAVATVFATIGATAQTRYVNPIYSEADIEVISDVKYGTNIDFLTSKLGTSNAAQIQQDMMAIGIALQSGQPIPANHYNYGDTVTTKVKVTDLKMDIYKPKSAKDQTTDRPVIVYLHTGNFLPPKVNGSPNGHKGDSSAIVLCTEWAKRGYVAIAMNYRLGWNPLANHVEIRKGQLLNAVYRAIHDTKHAVRLLKTEATTYGIDPAKITLYGEGTGAYVALAYETLDKNEEMELPKFRQGGSGPSYINRAQVGEINGSGGVFNLYPPSTVSTDIASVVTAGGALADTSWLEKGNVPMISFHCVRDAFAPFNEGTVIVPTTNEDVVDVQGANLYIKKANVLGNNDAIKDIEAYDPYTKAAEANYGATVDYIHDDEPNITINTEVKGLFPVLLPVAAEKLNNQSSPWQFWDPNSPLATHELAAGYTTHLNTIKSNPDMSPEKGRTYIDTILGYMCPRVALINGDISLSSLKVNTVLPNSAAKIYPNPTNGNVTVNIDSKYTVTTIKVLDIAGREVKTIETAKQSSTINLDNFEGGYYFINIHTTEGIISNKLIKK